MPLRSFLLVAALATVSFPALAQSEAHAPIVVDSYSDIENVVPGSCLGNPYRTTCLDIDGLAYTFSHQPSWQVEAPSVSVQTPAGSGLGLYNQYGDVPEATKAAPITGAA
jgi:hypothetical protein